MPRQKTKAKSTPVSPTTSDSATSLKEHLRQRAREARLVEANERLSRELSRAKARTSDLVEAVQRAVYDAASGLCLPPVSAPVAGLARTTRRGEQQVPGDAEKALVVLSDLQLAKVTPTYSTAVCESRVELLAEKVAKLTAIQRHDHPVREARVYLLGDIVEGELIFPSQPHQIDASLYRQVAVDGPRIVCNFLRSMLSCFERVHVVGVIGNHGAIGGATRRFHNPETNADRMLYRFVQELFRNEPRLTWTIPAERNERSWYAVDYPFMGSPENKCAVQDIAHGLLLFHGDQIRGGGFAGFPFYGCAKRIWGWRNGAVPEPFRYAVFGHWHTPTRLTLNDVTAWCNGSTESTNTYAQESLAAMGRPTQLLMFVHPRVGVTAEYWMNLE